MEFQWDKLDNILTLQSKALVGHLLRRIEVLDKERALSPSLYKALTKELVYENMRQTKALIKVHLEIGNVIFKTKSKEK